jgi:NAD(P)-dependent dehydrogenase (short-subunit alcohol dehydrogenase family)
MNLDQGDTVLIIGGGSGIGREIARRAAAAGAHLVLAGRTRSKLETVSAEVGGAGLAVLDAHDDAAVADYFANSEPIDHLVSMVGDSMSGGFMTTSPDTMRHVLNSKFLANWTIARHAAPVIRPVGSMTFTAGTGGRPHEASATAVANNALGLLVRGLAIELGPGVRVNAVAPTFMDTPFWRDLPRDAFEQTRAAFVAQVPLGRLATVGDVAASYIHLMSGEFITGQVLAIDGGVAAATATQP